MNRLFTHFIQENQRHIAVMSPDRFFCSGIQSLLHHSPLPSVLVHYCHSLKALRELINTIPLHGVMLREYGDNENISDWFAFCDFLRKEKPTLSVLVIRSQAKDDYQKVHNEYLNMAARPEEIRRQLRYIAKRKNGNLGLTQRENTLTHRELVILQRLCLGEKPVYISRILGIHWKTVSSHKVNALRKLGVSSLPSLLMKYHGLFTQTHKVQKKLEKRISGSKH